MRALFKRLRCHVQRHSDAWKHAHNATHLCYFGLVATHGPYHYAALALLVLGLAFYITRLEV